MIMSKNTVTIEDVKHIAQLCKLDVTGSEEKLASMFTETLKYIDVLEELDLSKINETYQVTGLTNVFQHGKDNLATLSKEDALKNGYEVIDDLFATKAVFDR
jgi:aspartyl/glutamyl-tRNA(Asn/Gln) amidotransferase C subunit